MNSCLLGWTRRSALPCLVLLFFFSAERRHDAQDKSTGFQCTVSAVTCGSVVTTATETEVCGVVELANVGKLTDKTYTQVTFFAGFRIGSEVLIIGGASAKGGMMVSCKVPWDDKKKAPEYERLKKELPRLLKDNPVIMQRFPTVLKIELDKNLRFDALKPAEVEALKKAYPGHKPK